MNRAVLITLVASGALLCTTSQIAWGKMTMKCQGEEWSNIAKEKYDNEEFGRYLAALNKKSGTEACPQGRFVRLLGTIKHTVRPGQTVRIIAKRFLRGKNAEAYLRTLNGLSAKAEPSAGQSFNVPTEVMITPKDLDHLSGLLGSKLLLTYNGISSKKKLRALKKIYAPVAPGLRAKPPQAPPQLATKAEPEKPKDDSITTDNQNDQKQPEPQEKPARETITEVTTAPQKKDVDRNTAFAPGAKLKIPKVVQTRNASAIRASYAEFTHATHAMVLGKEKQCQTCHIDHPNPYQAYFPVPEAVCTQCHAIAIPEDASERVNQLPLYYSHNQHLDPRGEVAKDYTTACALCHRPEDKGTMTKPGHNECSKCHNASENKVTVKNNCEACHGETEQFDRDLSAKLLLAEHLKKSVRGNNLVFAHNNHLNSLKQQGMNGDAPCETCHSNVRASQTLAEIAPQKMSDCLECHQGLRKVVNDTAKSLDECQTCHVEQATAFVPAFGNVVDKPLSHTIFFRKNHQTAAAQDEKVCQSCHSSLAGGSGQNCDRCHSQMRPTDHTPHYREHAHGRAAIRQPERCATCHQADRCQDCHSVRPRNHFPKQSFLQGGHGRKARFSPRNCLTCHQPERECASCHNVSE